VCEDFDLCATCYEGGKHDLAQFIMIDHPRSLVPKLLAPRRPRPTSSLPDQRGVRSRKPKTKDFEKAKKAIHTNRDRQRTRANGTRKVAVVDQDDDGGMIEPIENDEMASEAGQ
jgi:hypothetical protein